MVKTSPRGGAGRKPLSRSLRLYQRIAVGFVIATVLLLVVVLYLSISRATIRIIPVPKTVSTEVSVDVVPTPVEEGQMTGVVVEETFTKAKVFTLPSDGGTAIEQKAGGLVTLINKTNTAQPLVATTRLMSEEGVLFRIDETTNVPANGQVEVMAHADQPGLSGEVGPTQFTIPGLPASLQDDIYAVSVENMTGGVAYVRTLSEQDLSDAVTSLENEMREEARVALSEGVDRTVFPDELLTSEILERKSDTQPGTEAGSFTVSLTIDVRAVYIDATMLKDYVESELALHVPVGYEMVSVHRDAMQTTIESANEVKGEAVLDVYMDGISAISVHADVLKKDRFLGRSEQEVKTLLSVSEAVSSVNVTFTPFWLKRVPTLKDHISIDIAEPSN